MQWLNVLIQGSLLGGIYALLALGLAVVFSIVRLINFAHGEVMTIAGYAIWLALLSSVPVAAAILLKKWLRPTVVAGVLLVWIAVAPPTLARTLGDGQLHLTMLDVGRGMRCW